MEPAKNCGRAFGAGAGGAVAVLCVLVGGEGAVDVPGFWADEKRASNRHNETTAGRLNLFYVAHQKTVVG